MGECVEQLIRDRGLAEEHPVARWLRSTAVNYLVKNAGKPEGAEAEGQLSHVVDYLTVVADPAKTLPRGIKRIEPGRLVRVAWKDAALGAERWVTALNRQASGEVDWEGEEVVMELGDGYRLVKLISQQARAYEGKEMGHCVGGRGYEYAEIYSVRDANNKPHATIEMRRNTVVQCKGKENKAVVSKYIPYVQTAVKGMGWGIVQKATPFVLLIERQGQYFDVRNLPKNFVVEGDLNLDGCQAACRLPEGLQVRGRLGLGECRWLTELPQGLRIGGGLYLRSCTGLTTLPKGLIVGDFLQLGDCTQLKELPSDLCVGGNILLPNCKGLTTVPKGLVCGGYIDFLACTGLTSLPPMDRMKERVSGLSRMKIEELRANWDREHAKKLPKRLSYKLGRRARHSMMSGLPHPEWHSGPYPSLTA